VYSLKLERRLDLTARESAIMLSMCGRYRLSRRKQIIEEYFDTADWQDDWNPRYNIAPTDFDHALGADSALG
jgi:hypothetical protein